MREKIAYESPSPNEGRIEELKKLFPEAFSEGKLDVEKLVTLVGQSKVAGPERFNFTWNGKREALELLQTPSRATLLPCPEESVNFDTTKNLFIEGDNLEVLKLLLKPYFGKVKLIYIDPPYNTGQDFVYPDNYADPLATYLQLTGQSDSEGKLLTSNPETSGRYHSAWLSMIYPRLFLAKQLLREDGVIFISIDDHEMHHLRSVMDEIYGEENFVDCIVWKKRYGGGAKEKHLVTLHEYTLMYALNKEEIGELFVPLNEESIERYYKNKDKHFETRGAYRTHPLESMKSFDIRPNLIFPITAPDGTQIEPKRQWRWSKKRVDEATQRDELHFTKSKDGAWSVHSKQYLRENAGEGEERQRKFFSVIDDVYSQHGTNELLEIFGDAKVFGFPKPSQLLKRSLLLSPQQNDQQEEIVADFFSGSGTTAQAVLELNREDDGDRRFIMVQLPEPTDNKKFPTIAEIGKERIRRVIDKLKKTSDDTPILKDSEPAEDLGFKVFKLTKPSIIPPSDTDDKETYFKLLAQHNEPLVKNWKPNEVLWEVALREGFGLLSTFQEKTLSNGNTIHELTDPEKDPPGRCVICLDAKVKADISQAYELCKETLFICRDAALDDSAAANLALQCRLKTI